MLFRTLQTAGALVAVAGSCLAADLAVPGTFPDIQSAINAATSGDRIVVASGVYSGFNFNGKAVSVFHNRSTGIATIAGPGSGTLITATSSEGANSVVDGFLITGGGTTSGAMRINSASPTVLNCTFINNAASVGGGAVSITSTSFDTSAPLIRNCDFIDNVASSGGAVSLVSSSVTFEECDFRSNDASSDGGAVFMNASTATFTRCKLLDNVADSGSGGAVHTRLTSPATFDNCWIAENRADSGGGGGVWADFQCDHTYVNTTVADNSAITGGGIVNRDSDAVITNSIFWGNSASFGPQISNIDTFVFGPAVLDVDYSTLEGGTAAISVVGTSAFLNAGPGILSSDPLFFDEYHLLANSPAIDAGDPSFVGGACPIDIDRDQRVSTRVDQGADERGDLALRPSELSPAGGFVFFDLDAGAAGANKLYFLLGTFSGVKPGFVIDGITVPLNPDAYTTITLNGPAGSSGFTGTLDANGRASATLFVPNTLGPAFLGLDLNHVFVTFSGGVVDYASNYATLVVDTL